MIERIPRTPNDVGHHKKLAGRIRLPTLALMNTTEIVRIGHTQNQTDRITYYRPANNTDIADKSL